VHALMNAIALVLGWQPLANNDLLVAPSSIAGAFSHPEWACIAVATANLLGVKVTFVVEGAAHRCSPGSLSCRGFGRLHLH
jgi:hypothetical protein